MSLLHLKLGRGMVSAQDVAEYFLSLSDLEEGDNISALKLQKLLYYAQGFHLALFNKPLFKEPIVAWAHGPVVRSVWDHYRTYGSTPLPIPEKVNFDAFTTKQKELLNEVYALYGQYSAWRLRDMTHDEPPWKNTSQNEVISHELLKSYFKTQLVE